MAATKTQKTDDITEDTEPNFEDTVSDETSVPEDDDDLMTASDDTFVPERSFANAIPAPIDTWLPFIVSPDVEVTNELKWAPGEDFFALYAEHMSPEFGGRRWPYRAYLPKKPRERANAKKSSERKPQEPVILRFAAACGVITPENRTFRFSELPEQSADMVFMGQLRHRKPMDKEFSLPAVFGEHCALVSPVNGHHFSNNPYQVVVKVEDEMLDDPHYAVFTDDEDNTIVLEPVYDEDKIGKLVARDVEKKAKELEDSSLDEDEIAEFLDAERRFAERRARGLAYRNPAKGESTSAGAVFQNEHNENQVGDNGETAVFGTEDGIFTEEGYGFAAGTEITAFDGSEYTFLIKVPAPKDTKGMTPTEMIKAEQLSAYSFAPVPERVLGVKEEPGVEPHYQVEWSHVRYLAIGDTPVAPDTRVDTLDLNSDTGEIVVLRYGADSAWHLDNTGE